MKDSILTFFAQKQIDGIDAGDVNIPQPNTDSALQDGFNGALFIAGALCVLFIVIGGLRYVISQGDPGKTKQAKETIIYALIGLVFVALAFAIVQFVIGIAQG